MGAHLITGYAGKEHITAADQGLYNAGTLGTGKYVLPIGSMFEASIITNNLVKIKDGCLVNQGRNINIAVNDYEECEIDNGIQALKRNDLIVIRYEKNADTGIETASTIVIKGVSGETAVDPEYTKGNIFNGDSVDDFPLYRVKLEGLNITAVEPLFNTIVSFKTLIDSVTSLNKGLANTNKSVDDLNTNLTTHKTSTDHDSRYYTKTEIDARKMVLVQSVNDSYNFLKLYKDNTTGAHIMLYTRKIMVANTSTVITINSGHRPSSQVVFQSMCNHKTSGIGIGQLAINTDGSVILGSKDFNEELLGSFVCVW